VHRSANKAGILRIDRMRVLNNRRSTFLRKSGGFELQPTFEAANRNNPR
jgi:hypothetical protein